MHGCSRSSPHPACGTECSRHAACAWAELHRLGIHKDVLIGNDAVVVMLVFGLGLHTTSKTKNFRKTVSIPSTLDAVRRRSDLMNAAAIALHSESLNDSPQMNYRLYSDPFLIHFATVIKHNILIHLCVFYIILLISIAKTFAFVYN